MEYYVILSIATALVLALALLIWRKTKSIAFLIGTGFMYYWSLYGAWSIIKEKLGDNSERRYSYLYYKMFPIYLDNDYLWTIILYSLFILIVQVSVLYFARKPGAQPQLLPRAIYISHTMIIVMSAMAGFLSYLLVRDSLAAASDLNTSMHFLNPDSSPLYTLHQNLNRASLIPPGIGMAVYLSGDNAKYIVGKRSPIFLIGYIVILSGMFVFNMILGTRNNLMFAFVAMGLFYLVNTVRPSKLLVGGGGVLALAGVGLVGITRDMYKSTDLATRGGWEKITYFISELTSQNESFATHFSMYGCLHKSIPLTYGSSLIWLLTSVVPRVIWPERPAATYDYYVEGVGALQGQGYTIHHATGWYLNFGIPGVIGGAIILGLVWAKLFNRFNEVHKCRSHFNRLFSILAFFTFTAFIPVIIRDGPEIYKGVIVESFLIPTSFMLIASIKLVLRSNRPVLIPAHRLRPKLSLKPSIMYPLQRLK